MFVVGKGGENVRIRKPKVKIMKDMEKYNQKNGAVVHCSE